MATVESAEQVDDVFQSEKVDTKLVMVQLSSIVADYEGFAGANNAQDRARRDPNAGVFLTHKGGLSRTPAMDAPESLCDSGSMGPRQAQCILARLVFARRGP